MKACQATIYWLTHQFELSLIFRSILFFLHFIRRFWNQTRTCVSVKPSWAERRLLCCPEMYWSITKTFSSSFSWWAEKTVRPRWGLMTLSTMRRLTLSSGRGGSVKTDESFLIYNNNNNRLISSFTLNIDNEKAWVLFLLLFEALLNLRWHFARSA